MHLLLIWVSYVYDMKSGVAGYISHEVETATIWIIRNNKLLLRQWTVDNFRIGTNFIKKDDKRSWTRATPTRYATLNFFIQLGSKVHVLIKQMVEVEVLTVQKLKCKKCQILFIWKNNIYCYRAKYLFILIIISETTKFIKIVTLVIINFNRVKV